MKREIYKEMYREVLDLSIRDVMALIREAETAEERSFYGALLTWYMQRKQKIAIENNLF